MIDIMVPSTSARRSMAITAMLPKSPKGHKERPGYGVSMADNPRERDDG
jgi:hypothetical protein